MQHDRNQTRQNPRGTGDVAPREARDVARDREELAQLIGQLLARHWLRNQRDTPRSSAGLSDGT